MDFLMQLIAEVFLEGGFRLLTNKEERKKFIQLAKEYFQQRKEARKKD